MGPSGRLRVSHAHDDVLHRKLLLVRHAEREDGVRACPRRTAV